MDWCRLGTSFYLDRDVLGAGEAAELLFLRCIAYSGAEETAGRIPRHVIPVLARSKAKQRLEALLHHGLLIDEGDHLMIRSWGKWQEALDVEAERRRRDRERKRAERENARTVQGQSTDASKDIGGTVRAFSSRKEVEVEVEEETTKTSADADSAREDVERLCGYFVAALARNDVNANVTAKWRTEARLLLDRDRKDPAEIRSVIDWATSDPFWRANILSVPKFRSKYDQLRLAMQSRGGRRPVGDGIASHPDEAYNDLGIFGRGA